MSSGWFDCTEPSLCTLLQGKQGVQGAYAKVRGGSSTSNLIEPTRTTSSRIARCVEQQRETAFRDFETLCVFVRMRRF